MTSTLNPSTAVDVTADAGLGGPEVMLIVQREVLVAFPTLNAYAVPAPAPLPQDPGPNGAFIRAASVELLREAAPPEAGPGWSLWIEVLGD